MIFVDTSAWFGFLVPSDPQHERLAAWLAGNTAPLVTTDYCVDEILTLLAIRGEVRRAREAARAFFDGRLARLHFVQPDQIHRAVLVFEQRAAQGWSSTDCTSHVVIGDLGIPAAISLDAHFRQFGIQVAP